MSALPIDIDPDMADLSCTFTRASDADLEIEMASRLACISWDINPHDKIQVLLRVVPSMRLSCDQDMEGAMLWSLSYRGATGPSRPTIGRAVRAWIDHVLTPHSPLAEMVARLRRVDWQSMTHSEAQITLSMMFGPGATTGGFGWTLTYSDVTGPICGTPADAIAAWIEAADAALAGRGGAA